MQLTNGVPALVTGTPSDVQGVVAAMKRFVSPTALSTWLIHLFKPEDNVKPYSRVQHAAVIVWTIPTFKVNPPAYFLLMVH